jgi:hypothetical protein
MQEQDGMPEPHFAAADDDLPRTFRREREAREREGRLREMPKFASEFAQEDDVAYVDPAAHSGAVQRLQIPFLHLMGFCFKAVFAAIPALVLLTVLLWLGGQALSSFFPQLGKMQILIHFPKG